MQARVGRFVHEESGSKSSACGGRFLHMYSRNGASWWIDSFRDDAGYDLMKTTKAPFCERLLDFPSRRKSSNCFKSCKESRTPPTNEQPEESIKCDKLPLQMTIESQLQI